MIRLKFKEVMEAECLACDWKGKEYDVPNEDDVCPCCGSTKVFLI